VVLATILKAAILFWAQLVFGAFLLSNCSKSKEADLKNIPKPSQYKQNTVVRAKKADTSGESGGILSSEYELAGYIVALLSNTEYCSISFRSISSNADPQYLRLALSPPCYWLRGAFPTNTADQGLTDGIPVSNRGGIMAITYPSARNTTVAAIIGRAKGRFDDIERLAHHKGDQCGSHIQGLLLSKNGVRLSEPAFDVGARCSGTGLTADEKEFWLFAHDGLKKRHRRPAR
jgi:hypothetical protein